MSKGSNQRPRSISHGEFKRNWERIFGPCTFDEDGNREPDGQKRLPDTPGKVHGSGVQGSQDNRKSARDNDG